jgi:hypothetical protein
MILLRTASNYFSLFLNPVRVATEMMMMMMIVLMMIMTSSIARCRSSTRRVRSFQRFVRSFFAKRTFSKIQKDVVLCALAWQLACEFQNCKTWPADDFKIYYSEALEQSPLTRC